MNRAETALLLAKAQAYDRRTVGDVDVSAWQEALGDTDPTLAAEAITHHARTSDQWLTPKHVLDYVRQVEVHRMQDAGPCDYPSGLTQAQERNYRELWQMHIKRGLTRAAATEQADETLSVNRGVEIAAPADVRTAMDRFTARRAIS